MSALRGREARPSRAAEAREDALFISWVDRRGRSADLAEALGVRDWTDGGGRGPLPVRYLQLWRRTWALLAATRPRVVLVMLPPVVLLLLVRLWGIGRDLRIVGDLHTGVFLDPKWRWSAGLLLRLLGPDGTGVVTNAAVGRRVERAGVTALVLHDLIAEPPATVRPAHLPDAFVLAPLSYASDEPVDAILEAARRTPARTWVLTGRAPDGVRAAAPANVVLTGHLPDAAYPAVLQAASVVLAITTFEETMQRAGYEALGAGRALVASDRGVLRDFFGDAAVLVEPTADGIAAGVEQAFGRRPELEAAMRALRGRRAVEQRAALDALRDLVRS